MYLFPCISRFATHLRHKTYYFQTYELTNLCVDVFRVSFQVTIDKHEDFVEMDLSETLELGDQLFRTFRHGLSDFLRHFAMTTFCFKTN